MSSAGANAGSSLGNMVKDSAKVVGGLGDALRGNINSFADSAVDQTPKAHHNAVTGTTATTTTGTSGVVSRSAETGDETAAHGADKFKEGLDGLHAHGRR
ncbi:hypothetical protein QFC19_008673 [Naganishia cerealis]|uniref:Uncharacterized protein n=1 Tax=Naganishia cerealis TaxID=610337 RepID=A0ACC2UZW4_9TREE|nr:hypothetical protein QFC19_008673 [Naganishia cerealis]